MEPKKIRLVVAAGHHIGGDAAVSFRAGVLILDAHVPGRRRTNPLLLST